MQQLLMKNLVAHADFTNHPQHQRALLQGSLSSEHARLLLHWARELMGERALSLAGSKGWEPGQLLREVLVVMTRLFHGEGGEGFAKDMASLPEAPAVLSELHRTMQGLGADTLSSLVTLMERVQMMAPAAGPLSPSPAASFPVPSVSVLQAVYAREMKEFVLFEGELSAEEYSGHHFQRNVENASADSMPASKLTRLTSDHQGMAGGNLPLSTDASVFVCVDEERLDVMKAMLTGPSGTPYAYGLFEFDLFATHEYPKHPPMAHLRTTGKGTARFNPNLYTDGKVCLSLLGTWHGEAITQSTPQTTND